MTTATPAIDLDDVRRLLAGVIGDADAVAGLDGTSPLRATLPEFDSLAVTHVLLAIEERHGVLIDIEDVDDDVFATPDTLRDFIRGLLERRDAGARRSV